MKKAVGVKIVILSYKLFRHDFFLCSTQKLCNINPKLAFAINCPPHFCILLFYDAIVIKNRNIVKCAKNSLLIKVPKLQVQLCTPSK